jgi:hypothetical protein
MIGLISSLAGEGVGPNLFVEDSKPRQGSICSLAPSPGACAAWPLTRRESARPLPAPTMAQALFGGKVLTRTAIFDILKALRHGTPAQRLVSVRLISRGGDATKVGPSEQAIRGQMPGAAAANQPQFQPSHFSGTLHTGKPDSPTYLQGPVPFCGSVRAERFGGGGRPGDALGAVSNPSICLLGTLSAGTDTTRAVPCPYKHNPHAERR